MEIHTIAPFLDYYGKIRARTNRVISCIPPAQIEWRAHPQKFSFGDLIRHIAHIERFMYAETVHGRPSRYPGHGPEFVEGYDVICQYFNTLHEESLALFAQLDAADLNRKCQTPAGIAITTWKWLRAMVEHEVHHRGQIYMMLGLLAVPTPPLYGLTAEDVQARSV